ncbi:MAG: hypothetical protein WBB23_22875, partial [Desulforhopalus sp.]
MKEAILGIIGWLRAIGWNGSFLMLAVVLIVTILAVLAFSRKKETVVQNTIHLRDLSKIWTEEGTREIHISKLSPLWRDEQSFSTEDKTVQLLNPRAVAFMIKNLDGVWFKKFP